MLLTNHGELCQRLMHPDFYHEKEYRVEVDKTITPEFCQNMRDGVTYAKVTTKPCQVRQTGSNECLITLTQGMNRQIRRMCKTLGYKVTNLQRIRLGHPGLGQLPPGAYRELSHK